MSRGLLVAEAKAPQLWLGGHFQRFLQLLPHCTPFTQCLLEAPPPLFPCLLPTTELSKGSTLAVLLKSESGLGTGIPAGPSVLGNHWQCSFLVSLPVCCSAGVDGRIKGLMFNTVAVYGLAAAGYRLSLGDHNLFWERGQKRKKTQAPEPDHLGSDPQRCHFLASTKIT